MLNRPCIFNLNKSANKFFKMKFKLNYSPLTMAEVTKQLFNQQFLSDIQFSIKGKIIYAHSLELMKRSEVFQDMLQNAYGEHKLIPIVDFSYDSFFEFIRFIYTDQCIVNDRNGIELLKLAIKYKVVMLENKVINAALTVKWGIQLFEHCIVNNYQMARNFSETQFAFNLWVRLNSQQFLLLHPDALVEVLQLEHIETRVTEVDIFNALAKWIEKRCKLNGMSLSDGRHQFDRLIRKIRFPTMTLDELRVCGARYPGLLNESDIISMNFKQHILKRRCSLHSLWNSVPRKNCETPFQWFPYSCNETFKTSLSVSRNMLLYGLWIGITKQRYPLQVQIMKQDAKLNISRSLEFSYDVEQCSKSVVISLGVSIRLKPKYMYTINIKHLGSGGPGNVDVYCRKGDVGVFYSDPENTIKTIDPSANLFEIMLKLPA